MIVSSLLRAILSEVSTKSGDLPGRWVALYAFMVRSFGVEYFQWHQSDFWVDLMTRRTTSLALFFSRRWPWLRLQIWSEDWAHEYSDSPSRVILYQLLKAAAFKAGVDLPERSAFHIWRHTYATWMRQ
jgi:integrase